MDHWEQWQKPYLPGTVVIWPPDQVRNMVNEQRQRWDPASQAICEAHISVTQPLSQPLGKAEWAHLDSILAGFDPFEIDYGPLNTFLPYPCIWYEIKPREPILALRSAFHQTGYFNLELKHPENFIPHMTITEGLSGPEVDRALLQRLQEESGCGTFLCQELAFIVPDHSFQFQIHRTLPLGSGSPDRSGP